jgi:hypothetical protein
VKFFPVTALTQTASGVTVFADLPSFAPILRLVKQAAANGASILFRQSGSSTSSKMHIAQGVEYFRIPPSYTRYALSADNQNLPVNLSFSPAFENSDPDAFFPSSGETVSISGPATYTNIIPSPGRRIRVVAYPDTDHDSVQAFVKFGGPDVVADGDSVRLDSDVADYFEKPSTYTHYSVYVPDANVVNFNISAGPE